MGKLLSVPSIYSDFLALEKHVKDCNKKHFCKYCEKKFNDPSSLRRHENVHTVVHLMTILLMNSM